jgi:pimeloyl-ACP methyl ester carboxylesterase
MLEGEIRGTGMAMGTVTVDGRQLAYWRSGVAGDPPVLLVHGLGADHAGLLPLADHLGAADVIAVDLPGFGRSDPLRWNSPAGYAHAIESLCAALGLGVVTVIGHSLGATVALAHAAFYPDRVRDLALLMPVTSGTGPSSWPARAYYWLGSRLPEPVARAWFLSRAVVLVSDRLSLVTADKAVRRHILREDFRTAALASPRAIQEIYWSLTATPFLRLAGRIRATTAIIGAERDTLAPSGILSALADQLADGSLTVVASAGHLWPVESPAAAAELIRSRLAVS